MFLFFKMIWTKSFEKSHLGGQILSNFQGRNLRRPCKEIGAMLSIFVFCISQNNPIKEKCQIRPLIGNICKYFIFLEFFNFCILYKTAIMQLEIAENNN